MKEQLIYLGVAMGIAGLLFMVRNDTIGFIGGTALIIGGAIMFKIGLKK